ncbi:hypothetical protein [Burkholderia pyrrocinia]
MREFQFFTGASTMETAQMNELTLDKATAGRLRRMLARGAVNGGTARRMGPTGTVAAAQAFLAGLNLETFVVDSEHAFRCQLDKHTLKLQAALPKVDGHGQYWGAARKFLNIFLRHCAYNRYICAEYGLDRLLQWLELPLDRDAAKGLKAAEKEKASNIRSKLPYWAGVIHLTPAQSDLFQSFAKQTATTKNLYRVHLDILYWNAEPENK